MPNLRLFDIVAPMQPRHLKAIFTSFPALVMLSLGTLNPDDKTIARGSTTTTNKIHQSGASPLLPAQELATALQELHVARWACSPTALRNIHVCFNSVTRLNLQLISGYRNLLDLLRTFPALQELQLKKVCDLAEDAEVNYTLEPSFLTLKSIRIAKKAFSTSYSLNGLLSILPNLTEARFYTIYSETLSIIAEHCPQIEILEFTKMSQYISQLNLLLTNCTKLKSCGGPGLQIPYMDILNNPWVCKDLQKLDCSITETPYLTQDEQLSIKYIRNHWSQNITFPPTFDMPPFVGWDPSFANEDNWDMWHDEEKIAHRKYNTIKDVLCDVFERITKYTDLDTVQQDRMSSSSSTRTVWTSSKRGRPVSSMGRPLKATSRVLSENQVRWTPLLFLPPPPPFFFFFFFFFFSCFLNIHCF
jgi:hypothetical protein